MLLRPALLGTRQSSPVFGRGNSAGQGHLVVVSRPVDNIHPLGGLSTVVAASRYPVASPDDKISSGGCSGGYTFVFDTSLILHRKNHAENAPFAG